MQEATIFRTVWHATCSPIRLLKTVHWHLVDIDPHGLENSRLAIQRIIDEGHYPAHIEATTDRTEALPDADGVVCMLMAQPLAVFRKDLEICQSAST